MNEYIQIRTRRADTHTHTQTAETTGFSSGTVKNIHLSASLTTLSAVCVWTSRALRRHQVNTSGILLCLLISVVYQVSKRNKQTPCLSPVISVHSGIWVMSFSSLGSVTLNPPHFLYRSLSFRAVCSLAFWRLRRKKKKKKNPPLCPLTSDPSSWFCCCSLGFRPPQGGVRVCSGQRFWSVPTSGGVVSWSDRVSPPIVLSVALSFVHSLVQPGPRLQSASPGGHKRHFTATMWDQHRWKSQFHCFRASSSMLLLLCWYKLLKVGAWRFPELVGASQVSYLAETIQKIWAVQKFFLAPSQLLLIWNNITCLK